MFCQAVIQEYKAIVCNGAERVLLLRLREQFLIPGKPCPKRQTVARAKRVEQFLAPVYFHYLYSVLPSRER